MVDQLHNFLSMMTKPNSLKDLQSSSNKIIVYSDDVILLPSYIEDLAEISFYEFKFLGDSRYAEILPLRENVDGGDLVEIQWAPQFILGFISLSMEGRQAFESFADWWIEKGRENKIIPHIQLDPRCDKAELEACFWRQLAHHLLGQTTSLAQRVSTLHRQYLSLRTLHEDIQNAFSSVEDFLSQAKLPDLQLKFENSPTKMLMTPVPQKHFVLRQLLPVGSKGLAAVDLYVGEQSKGEGMVLISVEIPEERTCLAKWSIDYQHLVKGWIHLDLPRIDIGFQREIVLKLEFQTHIGSMPCFSLGTHQPVPEYQAYVDGNDGFTVSRSLALRLWTGLPGTRRVISPYSIDVVGGDNALPINRGYLGQRSLLTIKEVSSHSPTDEFQPIRIIGEGQKILVHPRKDQLTIAMLPHCFPPGFRHLTATVATEHPKADKIEYAMALVTKDMDAKACFESGNSDHALFFSGWKEVEPETPSQLAVSIEPNEAESHHIVIATRLAQDSSPYFAWAHWLNFYIER